MTRYADLPISSPFIRRTLELRLVDRPGSVQPLYVVPVGKHVVLATSDGPLTSVPARQLTVVLQAATGPESAEWGSAESQESRCEVVLLEERVLLAELKRLSKGAPELIADFRSGDLAVADQVDFASRLMHVAETLLVHGKAREWVARSQGDS